MKRLIFQVQFWFTPEMQVCYTIYKHMDAIHYISIDGKIRAFECNKLYS